MSILKYTTKYFLYGGLVLLVIFAIVGFILSQHQKKELETGVPSDNTVELPMVKTPPAPQPSGSGGHFHADGTWHTDSSALAIQEDATTGTKNAIKATSTSRCEGNASKSSLGWITWKYASDRRGQHHPARKRLPKEIERDALLLKQEQVYRESLQNSIEEARQYGEEMDLKRDFDFVVEMAEAYFPEPRKLLFDKKGKPLPPFTEAEYKEEELRRLVGDRDLESATQFLEEHNHYNDLLLSRLDGERAFEYLYTIASPNGSGVPDDITRVYAERVVASDPTHLKARLYLADTLTRSSAAASEAKLAQYESILVDHPDSPHALVEAAAELVFLERPLQAIEYLKKGHELGARHGFFDAAMAYQQIGDYKTAWVYLHKAARLPSGHSTYEWSSAGQIEAIEAGNPIIKPLPVEKLDIPKTGSLPIGDSPLPEFGFDTSDEPFSPPPDDALFDNTETMHAEAEAAARAREQARREEIRLMQQVSQQEIDDFIQWAEQLMQREAQEQATDFLMQEMAAHLTGAPAQFSPERIVHANEIIQRYGAKEGLQRLKLSDPEIAIQIQLLRNQEPIPKIGK